MNLVSFISKRFNPPEVVAHMVLYNHCFKSISVTIFQCEADPNYALKNINLNAVETLAS